LIFFKSNTSNNNKNFYKMQKKIFSLTDVFFLNLNSFKFQRSRILLFLFHFFVLVVFVPYHLAFFVEKNK